MTVKAPEPSSRARLNPKNRSKNLPKSASEVMRLECLSFTARRPFRFAERTATEGDADQGSDLALYATRWQRHDVRHFRPAVGWMGRSTNSQSSQTFLWSPPARACRRFGLARDFLDPFSLIRTCCALPKTVSSNVSRNCATATAGDGRAAPLQLF